MASVIVERILEERDVDAALFLLGRMLGLRDDVVGTRREELETLWVQLVDTREITPEDRRKVVSAYRDIVG